MLLDVVYNHLGPDGNYLAQVRRTISRRSTGRRGDRPSTWMAREARTSVPSSSRTQSTGCGNSISTACGWTRPTVSSTTARGTSSRARRGGSRVDRQGRTIHLIAEDARNLATLVRPVAEGGWGSMESGRTTFTTSSAGTWWATLKAPFATFAAACWTWCGRSTGAGCSRVRTRFTAATFAAPTRPVCALGSFVFYIQNHDRIGNRGWASGSINRPTPPHTVRPAAC